MATKFRVVATDAEAADLEDALWQQYYAEEIAARGLRPGDSLFTAMDGTRVRIPELERYTLATVVPGRNGKVVELDDRAQAWHGRVVRVRGRDIAIVATGADLAALPQDVQDKLRGGPGPQGVIAPQGERKADRKLKAADYVHAQRPAEPRPPAGPPPRERFHVPTGVVIAIVTLGGILAALVRHC